jgi:hypothetical protein
LEAQGAQIETTPNRFKGTDAKESNMAALRQIAFYGKGGIGK